MAEKTFVKKPKKTPNSFLQFFRGIGLIFRLVFVNFEWQAITITIALAAFSIAYEFVSLRMYDINADFATSMAEADYKLFISSFWAGITNAAFSGTIGTIGSFIGEITSTLYRRNSMGQSHRKYYAFKTYYRLNCINNEGVDNPDQRILSDVSNVSNFFAVTFVPLLTSWSVVVAAYSYRVQQFAGWEGIGTLYGATFLGIFTNFLFVKPLGKLYNKIEFFEGTLRYKHATIRNHSESTAMYKAEDFENTECRYLVNGMIKTWFKMAAWEFPAEAIKTFFGGMENIMICIILYFPLISEKKDVDHILAYITVHYSSCHYLISKVGQLSDNLNELYTFAGILKRVHEFFAFADKNWKECAEQNDDVTESNVIYAKSDHVYQFQSVCFGTPTIPSKVIVNDLNLSLKKNENLLLTGPSGCGKSSVLRVVTRLWKIQSGMLTIGVPDKEVFVIPQKPYFPTGNLTLRQQIIFPKLIDDRNVSDKEMLEFIADLHLETVLEKCGGLNTPVDFEWHERFTPAELQQISFMRVLYHQPKLVLMDDVSSCCSASVEQRLYELLDGLGISYISAGNRVSLRAFHHKELKLHGDGTYEVVDLRDDPLV